MKQRFQIAFWMLIEALAISAQTTPFDPLAQPGSCFGEQIDSSWMVRCGVYGFVNGSRTAFTCPTGRYISRILGTYSAINRLTSLRAECNDGTLSPVFGTETETSWVGPSTQIFYALTNSNSGYFHGLQYGNMSFAVPPAMTPQTWSHSRDNTFGCPLFGLEVASNSIDFISSLVLIFRCPFCGAGRQINSLKTSCSACPVNTFKPISGPTQCTTCPANSQCSDTDFVCPVGYGWNSSAFACNLCPLGQLKMKTGNVACIPCPQNSIACTDSTFNCLPGFEKDLVVYPYECRACTQGFTFSRNEQCLTCPLNSNCTTTGYQCLPGFQKNQESDLCEKCPVNTFKSLTGNGLCQTCPANSFCDRTGWLCNSGYKYNTTSETCVACQLNAEYKPTISNGPCLACPPNAQCSPTSYQCNPGFQNTGPGQCTGCPSGLYKPASGNEACMNCPDGALCNSTAVYTCMPGFFYGETQKLCWPCSSTSFKPTFGLQKCTSCSMSGIQFCNATTFWCKAGFQTQGTQCVPCPNGFFKSTDDSTNCKACPLNSKCTTTGFTCLADFEFNSTMQTCTSCEDGTFKLTNGNFGCEPCQQEMLNPPSKCFKVFNYTFTVTPQPTLIEEVPPIPSQDAASFFTLQFIGVLGGAFLVFVLLLATVLVFKKRKMKRQHIFAAPRETSRKISRVSSRNSVRFPQTINNTTVMSSIYESEFATGTTYMSSIFTMGQTTIGLISSVMAIPGFMKVDFQDYMLSNEIAVGGSAKVYLARPQSNELRERCKDEFMVAKVFLKMTHEIQKSLFIQEVSLLYRFSKYPHFCQFYGFDEGNMTLLTKYYSKKSLHHYLHQTRPLAVLNKRLIAKLLKETAVAVQYLHNADIAHCDLKTDNILIDSCPGSTDISAVLGDFGVARILSDETRVFHFPKVHIPAASITYAAPEILKMIRNRQDEDRRHTRIIKAGDIYSFGCLIYEVISRRTPWISREKSDPS